MKQDLDVSNHAKAMLELKVDALSARELSETIITNDESKIHYYTGLPSCTILRAIFTITAKGLSRDDTQACTLFEHFLITLIKLRLNLSDQDLAYRFALSQPSVSSGKWLDLLSTKFLFLIHWPDRQELMKTMPSDFQKHFKKCIIIIDCFEIFIERPTSLKARAQTYSNYEKHVTFFQEILVLADRGFTIQQAIGLFCAEVKIPPFTKGKNNFLS